MSLSDLFEKYDSSGPRYTSYPPIPFWKDTPLQSEWLDNFKSGCVESNKGNVGIGIYMHIPFCRSLCLYCGCNNFITKDMLLADEYVDVVLREFEIYRSQGLPASTVAQCLHLGGGTPTYLLPIQLEKLLVPILDEVKKTETFEFSVEVDPRRTTYEHLKLLKELGCTRLSLGIQDFNPEVQKKINRIQPFEDVQHFMELVDNLGFKDINFDLIYGLPLQATETLEDTFDKVLVLNPSRIAFYSYAHVPWMRPAQAKLEPYLPSAQEKRKLFECGRALLLKNNYLEIGMDHFARPTDLLSKAIAEKTLHRNFMGYTDQKNIPLLPLGVSAIGETQDFYIQNEKDLKKYMDTVSQGRLPIVRGHRISKSDRETKGMILDLLTKFEHRFPDDSRSDLLKIKTDALSEFVTDGLVSYDDRTLRVSDLGRAFIRNICMALDPLIQAEAERKYSKTI